MGLLARIAAALRSALGRADGSTPSEDAGAADGASSPTPDDYPGDDTDESAAPSTTDCSVCGTTFEADAESCPLCGTPPGSDDASPGPEPETDATDGTATDDAAARLRDLRDERE
jgi:hypothetical protein